MQKPAITARISQAQGPPLADAPTLSYRGPPSGRRLPVSNAVLGTVIFVIAETMMFAGLISAFAIVKAQALGAWPAFDQPRLPIEETAINTAALLLSGAVLVYAGFVFQRAPLAARRPLLFSIALGAFFVAFQGAEWVALLQQGLGLTTSTHGSFFYLIVGTHALHAVAALIVLGYCFAALQRRQLLPARFHAAQVFWYFVVGLWPILYLQVYL